MIAGLLFSTATAGIKIPLKNQGDFSLTLKTTNMNDVDSYTTLYTSVGLFWFAIFKKLC